MAKLTISKLDAVRVQLDAAIEMYFVSDNPVAVHTLTAAAYNVLRDIASKNGSDRPFIKTKFINEYSESKRKAIRNFINALENFFKHADRDPVESLTFDPELTEVLLMDACAYFRDKDEPRPKYYDIFKAWSGVPKDGLNEGERLLVEAAREIFKCNGKREFWRLAVQHLTSGVRSH